MSRQRAAHQRGFTLIELMIVIAIVGILAAVVVPALKRYMDRSRKEHVAQTVTSTDHAGVIHAVERAGFSQVEVIDSGEAFRKQPWSEICRADSDVAFEVDATDKQERRIRLTVCCHRAADSTKCAIPLPMHHFLGDR